MALAAPPIPISTSSSSSSSSSSTFTTKPPFLLRAIPTTLSPPSIHFHPPSRSLSLSLLPPSLLLARRAWTPRVSATAAVVDAEKKGEEEDVEEFKLPARPCELYVCNLPRSCDVSELLELFKPFGTVQSVEVSRNTETGVSKGCGYVTMASLPEARAAMATLDGSDLGGREMRVKFSADMVGGRKNTAAQNTAPKRDMVFESPYKAYVGNLAWSVRPEDLREYFSQFGTVVSTRLLQDKKAGKTRVYGFVSFSAENELKAAAATTGTEFRGRKMLVREVVRKE